MKRLWILLIIAVFCTSGNLFAQEKGPKQKIMDRLTYMKEHLTVSEKASANFWKSYEQYLKDERAIMDNYRKNLEKQGIKLGAPGTNKEMVEKLSDKQLTYLQDQKFDMRKKMLDLEYSYYKKFKTMLPPQTLQKLYNLEYKYKRTMTAKMKDEKKKKNDEIGPVNTGKKKR